MYKQYTKAGSWFNLLLQLVPLYAFESEMIGMEWGKIHRKDKCVELSMANVQNGQPSSVEDRGPWNSGYVKTIEGLYSRYQRSLPRRPAEIWQPPTKLICRELRREKTREIQLGFNVAALWKPVYGVQASRQFSLQSRWIARPYDVQEFSIWPNLRAVLILTTFVCLTLR